VRCSLRLVGLHHPKVIASLIFYLGTWNLQNLPLFRIATLPHLEPTSVNPAQIGNIGGRLASNKLRSDISCSLARRPCVATI
jgi:hypothetical protein